MYIYIYLGVYAVFPLPLNMLKEAECNSREHSVIDETL